MNMSVYLCFFIYPTFRNLPSIWDAVSKVPSKYLYLNFTLNTATESFELSILNGAASIPDTNAGYICSLFRGYSQSLISNTGIRSALRSNTWFPLDKSFSGPQIESGHYEEEKKKIAFLSVIEPDYLAVHLVTHRYVNWAIRIPKFVVVIDLQNKQPLKIFLVKC